MNFLRSLNHGLNERWPTGIYTAEDSTNFLKVTAPTRYDGVGFDYKWDMGSMHDTLDYFATPFGERPGGLRQARCSAAFTFYNELYLLALSHDEVVHGKKTIIDKLWAATRKSAPELRTLYFYMYTHPGKAELHGQRDGTLPGVGRKAGAGLEPAGIPLPRCLPEVLCRTCAAPAMPPSLHSTMASTTPTALSGWPARAAARACTHGCAKGGARTCCAS